MSVELTQKLKEERKHVQEKMAHLQENFTGKVFVVLSSKVVRQRVFQAETGYKNSCMKFLSKCTCGRFFKSDFVVREPPEPGDIIWENLSVTSSERCKRKILTTILSFFLILGCFLAVFFVSRYKIDRIETVKEVAVEEMEEEGTVATDEDGNVVLSKNQDFKLQVFSLVIATVISLANYISKIILTKFAAYQRRATISK